MTLDHSGEVPTGQQLGAGALQPLASKSLTSVGTGEEYPGLLKQLPQRPDMMRHAQLTPDLVSVEVGCLAKIGPRR